MTIMEILKLALMNTLLGMGTVFLVLIFIILIISGFKYLPRLVGGHQEKGEEVPSQPLGNQSQGVSPEIVAVITAAIMSFGKQTGDQYVVRGIKRARQHGNFMEIDNKINEDINW